MSKSDDDIKKPDRQKKPPGDSEEELHRSDDALGDAPAGGPDATKRSRLAD
jgi:hypothetical protein